jgi:hypothetical protein
MFESVTTSTEVGSSPCLGGVQRHRPSSHRRSIFPFVLSCSPQTWFTFLNHIVYIYIPLFLPCPCVELFLLHVQCAAPGWLFPPGYSCVTHRRLAYYVCFVTLFCAFLFCFFVWRFDAVASVCCASAQIKSAPDHNSLLSCTWLQHQ